MDLEGIKSDDMTLSGLLQSFYVVPKYQREYVWTTDEVEQLLDDIYSEFIQQVKDHSPDYFIGTIVANYNRERDLYELVDGQQRVTTLYIILCAIRDYLFEIGNDLKAVDTQLAALSVDQDGNETQRFRVELQYEDSQNVLEKLVSRRGEVPLDSIKPTTRSAVNLVQAYADSRAFLAETLGGDAQKIRKFYAFLTQNVKLIRVQTETLNKALWIFETINQRGRGLDAMDLLKNLLFRETNSDSQIDALTRRWKALVDSLYAVKENPMRFIRYFILAYYTKDKLQADRVYEWFNREENIQKSGYKKDPVGFTDELLAAAHAYSNFLDGKLEDGTECRNLKNVYHMSHTARQHLILMLAARELPNESIIRLAQEIEDLYFVFIVTKRPKNVFETKFVDWASRLRGMRTAEELEVFLEEYVVPERNKLAEEFEQQLRKLNENDLPKYRLKYILGKMAQYVDELAYGRLTEHGLLNYLNGKVEVEHILSINAGPQGLELFGGKERAMTYMHRLANLTLLEKPLNIVASNKTFEMKRTEYSRSKYLLTKGLTPDARVGADTSVNRALRFVDTYDSWTPDTLRAREDKLVELALSVWNVENPKKNVVASEES